MRTTTVEPLSETTVLIPAAGPVPEGVLSLSNIATPAMIPVAGRPIIHWTVSYLYSLGLRRFVLALPRRGLFVEEYIASAFGDDCEFSFIVPPPGGLGETMHALAQQVSTQRALVVLGDTYFRFDAEKRIRTDAPFVLVHPVDDPFRWCVAETNSSRQVTALHDKDATVDPSYPALVGVYYFPDASLLSRATTAATAAPGRTEMSKILDAVAEASPVFADLAGEWLDCGNPDRQAASHRALLQVRAFNEVSIDAVRGTIKKKSGNVEKFIDEINYLRLLPKDLAVLFPRLLDYSVAFENPWMEMEYYGYPTLSDVFVFENLDAGIWEQVFRHLLAIMEEAFGAHRRPLHATDLASMYFDKTFARIGAIDPKSPLGELLRRPGPLNVNGRRYSHVDQLRSQLEARIKALAVGAEGAIIHGDLCFSNILYDLRSRVCKLIDPRGSFGRTGLFGDPRYDVAKLYHSVRGQYDLIINDLFTLEDDGEELRFHVRATERHDQVTERFERVFFQRFSRSDITLLTGLLFASMPALHYDRSKRQLAMYLRAVELLEEALFEDNSARGDAAA